MPKPVEGKNIHYSPVDKKPLCSYSNKLCRQRRLNGFGFCIRHILEDKSAPFKQCEYVTRNNSQKCLNAIPTNQERGYCHSHMQVAGIIPKTERKSKPAGGNCGKLTPSAGEADKLNGHAFSSSTQSKSNNKPNSTKQLKLPTSKSKSDKAKSIIATGTKEVRLPVVPTLKNSIINEPNVKFISTTTPFIADSSEKKKSKVTSKNISEIAETVGDTLYTDGKPVSKRKKKIPATVAGKSLNSMTKSSASSAFEQLKSLKVLEKCPVSTELSSQVPSPHVKASHDEMTQIGLVPPFFKKSSHGINGFSNHFSETRREYLNRIRSSLENQYKLLRHVVRLNEKSDMNANQALRESLLKCVVLDPSRCAHILVNGEDIQEPKKKKGVKGSNGLLPAEKRKVTSDGDVKKLSGDNRRSTSQKKTNCSISQNGVQLCQNYPTIGYGVKVVEQFETPQPTSSLWIKTNSEQSEITNTHTTNKKRRPVAKLPKLSDTHSKIQDKKNSGKEVRNEEGMLGMTSTSNIILPPASPQKKWKKQNRKINPTSLSSIQHQPETHLNSIGGSGILSNHHHHQSQFPLVVNPGYGNPASFLGGKRRRLELSSEGNGSLLPTHSLVPSSHFHPHHHHHLHQHILDPNITLNATAAFHPDSDLTAVSHYENVLHSVSSSDTATTPDGVITDASFDSPFDHSTSSHADVDFPEDVEDFERTFELHIDAEIAHQASRLIEENGFTTEDDDFSDLFPESRLTDHKLGSDLGLDFPSATFEPSDIDYSIFSNIFQSSTTYHRPPNSNESISITPNF